LTPLDEQYNLSQIIAKLTVIFYPNPSHQQVLGMLWLFGDPIESTTIVVLQRAKAFQELVDI
jgi:hypothetical protein